MSSSNKYINVGILFVFVILSLIVLDYIKPRAKYFMYLAVSKTLEVDSTDLPPKNKMLLNIAENKAK